jgi:hypothetical protein
MRVAILQPSYLPWIGYFDQIAKVDQFVFLDNIQFTRRDWRNRNKIRTAQGWSWLTVPVIQKNRFAQTLLETQIDSSSNWRTKHLNAIRHNYIKTEFFDLYFPKIETIINKDWDLLVDLCLELTENLKNWLSISTPTVRSSDLNISEKKGDKILALCRKLKATHYLTGDLAKDYLNESEFLSYNIRLEYHNYKHPPYLQRYPEFVPYMSVVDLLFNQGEKSLEILQQTQPSS